MPGLRVGRRRQRSLYPGFLVLVAVATATFHPLEAIDRSARLLDYNLNILSLDPHDVIQPRTRHRWHSRVADLYRPVLHGEPKVAAFTSLSPSSYTNGFSASALERFTTLLESLIAGHDGNHIPSLAISAAAATRELDNSRMLIGPGQGAHLIYLDVPIDHRSQTPLKEYRQIRTFPLVYVAAPLGGSLNPRRQQDCAVFFRRAGDDGLRAHFGERPARVKRHVSSVAHIPQEEALRDGASLGPVEVALTILVGLGSLALAFAVRPQVALALGIAVAAVLLGGSYAFLAGTKVWSRAFLPAFAALAPMAIVIPTRWLLLKKRSTRSALEASTAAGLQPESAQHLGKYRVVREIGTGAMGKVYEAVDTETGERAAIKTMRANLSSPLDPRQKQRFLREAQAAGSLDHPNIVSVYGVGEEGTITYIAMEYLEGATLEQVLARRAPLSLSEVYTILRPICEALDYAHRRGVIHRDIKPANIMITRSGVKVMDFGIARVSHSTMTATGSILGTPSYMSPEQIRGEVVDGRSDIFSLGVLLYEMCTGVRAFSGSTLAEITDRIVNHQPEPITKLNPAVPSEIEVIAQRMLGKDRTERFERPIEIVAEIRQILQHEGEV